MRQFSSSSSYSSSSSSSIQYKEDRRRVGGRRTRTSILISLALFCLTNCQTIQHQFAAPGSDWKSRIGQLQYRSPKTSLIGEVLVRSSSQGDFELTFTKGPGVVLLTVRQDDHFVRVSGPLARGSWSGVPNNAPTRLQGWVSLRDVVLRGKNQALIRQTAGPESFTFAF